MIIYGTKVTVQRFGMIMPEEHKDPIIRQQAMNIYQNEKGQRLAEWGAKIFYLGSRKCIQLCNFATRFTILLIDMKKADLINISNLMGHYLLSIYEHDSKMMSLVIRYLSEYSPICYGKLQDKKNLGQLNRFQMECLDYDPYPWEFLENGIIQTTKMNRRINDMILFEEKIDGRKQVFTPYERMKLELMNTYLS